MTLDNYLTLLDFVGRQIRDDKRGAIPAHLAPILKRLGLEEQRLVDTVRNFSTLFSTLVGHGDVVRRQAARMGRRWVHGVRNCEAAFG